MLCNVLRPGSIPAWTCGLKLHSHYSNMLVLKVETETSGFSTIIYSVCVCSVLCLLQFCNWSVVLKLLIGQLTNRKLIHNNFAACLTHLSGQNAKYLLVSTTQMWGISQFCITHIEYLLALDKTSTFKTSLNVQCDFFNVVFHFRDQTINRYLKVPTLLVRDWKCIFSVLGWSLSVCCCFIRKPKVSSCPVQPV